MRIWNGGWSGSFHRAMVNENMKWRMQRNLKWDYGNREYGMIDRMDPRMKHQTIEKEEQEE